MEIKPDDDRNIVYWALRYSGKGCEFEDLRQEGRLACLLTDEASHKYNNIRQAIRSYARKEAQWQGIKDSTFTNSAIEGMADRSEGGLLEGDAIEDWQWCLDNAKLSKSEKEVIEIYFFSPLNPQEIATMRGKSWSTIRTNIEVAVKKLSKAGKMYRNAIG